MFIMGSRRTEDICGPSSATMAHLASKEASSTSRRARLENVNQRFLTMVNENGTDAEEDLGWLDEYSRESYTTSPCLASQRLKTTVKIIMNQHEKVKHLEKKNTDLKMLIAILKQKNMVSEPEKIISDIINPPDIPEPVKDLCRHLLLGPYLTAVKNEAPDDQLLNEAPVSEEEPLQEEPFSPEPDVKEEENLDDNVKEEENIEADIRKNPSDSQNKAGGSNENQTAANQEVRPSSSPRKTKIFVGHLPACAQSFELQRLFEKYGVVTECDVLDRFGFVHMKTEEMAARAIKELDNVQFMGEHIVVEQATGKKNSKGGFGPMRGRSGREGVGRDPPYGMREVYDRLPGSLPPSATRNGYYDNYDRVYKYYSHGGPAAALGCEREPEVWSVYPELMRSLYERRSFPDIRNPFDRKLISAASLEHHHEYAPSHRGNDIYLRRTPSPTSSYSERTLCFEYGRDNRYGESSLTREQELLLSQYDAC